MKNNPDIFFFFPLAGIGGTEKAHIDIVKALKKYARRVYIRYKGNVWKGFDYAQTQKAHDEGTALFDEFNMHCKTIFLSELFEAESLAQYKRPYFIKRIARKINSSKNPIVIFWHFQSIKEVLSLLNENVKLIDIIHNLNPSDNDDLDYLNISLFNRLNHRIAISDSLKTEIIAAYETQNIPEIYQQKISVIPHAVPIPEPVNKTDTGKLNILFVGRNAYEKRLDLWLEIANNCSDFANFTIVGPETEKLKANRSISVVGPITDNTKLNEYYAQSHLLMLTSLSEGFPKTIAEGMAYGCVPLTTNVGGISDFVKNNENGILVENKDEAFVINEMSRIINELYHQKDRLQKLSVNSYQSAIDHFSFENFKTKWLETIENV
ncbi:MAG: hypothetical protein C0594_17365 [Marinilabiliales bacterium]|nr:MAG: hypothetical protein C0594_17365 [Marinilabiliales bacterium]